MKIINDGLPEPIYQAILKHEHKKGDYSITELISPTQQTILKIRHDDKIVEPASSKIWSLFGKAFHKVAEEGSKDVAHMLSESYVEITVLGRSISGTNDLYDAQRKCISDFKTTSVYTVKNDSRGDSWSKQLNCYAYLFFTLGIPVEFLEVVALLKDFRPSEAKRDPEYPQTPIQTIVVDPWVVAQQKQFIEDRVIDLVAAEKLADKELPKCTPEDRWETPEKWAVMKEGRKSAIKLYDTQEDANKALQDVKSGYVQHRPSVSKRCEGYCQVKDFCVQYQEIKKTTVNTEKN